MKIHQLSVALTAGLLVGIFTCGFTLISVFSGGYGQEYLSIWIPLHPGYSISIMGAFIGFAYSFVEAFLWGYVGSWLYNFLVDKLG